MLEDDSSLAAFLTDKELPSCLNCWKNILRNESRNNVGLALRWEAGLASMTALSIIPDERRIKISNEWAERVKSMVNEADMIDVFCVERSIVSIRIANNDDGWLNMDEARDLYRWMSLDVSSAVSFATSDERAVLSTPIFIGQPVAVTDSHAIVRIALGAESLLSYDVDKEQTLRDDKVTIEKLSAIAKYFSVLKASRI